jgi:glycosyltransferase involved in cell wall biosynthesis
MNGPVVSVILSMHNEQPYVARAVESILAQTFADLELIIIDDYSTDDSVGVCRSFTDPRIRLHVKTGEGRHLAASRNLGVQMAKGRFVMFQDADDVSDPTRLEKQLAKALENPLRRVVGASVRRVEGTSETMVQPPETHDEIVQGFQRLYNRTTIISGTILAPRDILLKVPYRTKFKYMQDWDHMVRLHESGQVEFYNCQEPLYTYYIRPKGVLFKPDWLDYNIFVRNCQERRRSGLIEFETLRAFKEHLNRHLLEKIKWLGLRTLIYWRKQMTRRDGGPWASRSAVHASPAPQPFASFGIDRR